MRSHLPDFLICFVGLGYWVVYLLSLPRPGRVIPCLLAALPAAFLTFFAVLAGGPGDLPAGGSITSELLASLLLRGTAGVAFLFRALLSLGPTGKKR